MGVWLTPPLGLHVLFGLKAAFKHFGHVFQSHAQCFLGRMRAYRHEIGDVCSQIFPLVQESSIDFHRTQKLHAPHRYTVLCLLLLSARCVTLHLCSEGRPVGANLTRQSVATDKRGYLVQPFACCIQLSPHFRFDLTRHFTHLVHTCRARLWDLHTFRERNFIKFSSARLLKRECLPTQKSLERELGCPRV